MIISLKDVLKFVGVIIVVFCAVFVCTFFLNFYLDAQSLKDVIIDPNTQIIYNAQMATSKLTCAISGGFLGLIAVIMLVFYIRLYIDGHASQIGILKAMGYSDGKIAFGFAVFGINVLIGALLGFGAGFAYMPVVYDGMAMTGLPEVKITFHVALLFMLVVLPFIVFSLLSVTLAYFVLKRPVLNLLRNNVEEKNVKKKAKAPKEKERGFLLEMCVKTLSSKKSLAFFIAFACFCFSAMVQMSASMYDLAAESFGGVILIIGLVLAVTTLFMAVTSIVKNNAKNVSVMKAFGYSMKECSMAVLGGYTIFAVIGFAVGTVYQYGLLSLMVNLVYKDVGELPDYKFNVPIFFITLSVLVALYMAVMLVCIYKLNKVSVKEVMAEN